MPAEIRAGQDLLTIFQARFAASLLKQRIDRRRWPLKGRDGRTPLLSARSGRTVLAAGIAQSVALGDHAQENAGCRNLLIYGLGGIIVPIIGIKAIDLAVPSPVERQSYRAEQSGKIVGSALIGQQFSGAGYFHGRPSATTAPDPNDATKTVEAPYNAANSVGSNLGPTNKALVERVKADVEKLKRGKS